LLPLGRGQQREHVVALNNSESAKTAAIPTYIRNGDFAKAYGSGLEQLASSDNRLLTLTVPALSTVVYESANQIPRSGAAPQISLEKPVVSAETNSRMLVSAIVGGSSFNEVTSYAKVGNDKWQPIGTDDTVPYRSPMTSARSRTGSG
jgi:alpha-amylase